MGRTENAELTVLCLLESGEKYLMQHRVKKDWRGLTLPGGHVERDESIVDAVIREMREETGLTVLDPKLCGVKQFPIAGGRYIVFLFRANEYTGILQSSEEGTVEWVDKGKIAGRDTVEDLDELLRVMLSDTLNEFQYVVQDGNWNVSLH